jgi:type II secretion system protein I
MRERGFTLLEVVVALAILALSLGVLMHAMASSLNNAGRTRGLTFAALLARSKMVDIEQQLFDEGFTLGDANEDGNFADEGHPEIKWSAKIMEVELDLDMLQNLAGGAQNGGDKTSTETGDVSSLLGGLTAPLQGLTQQMSDAMRVVDLTVTWPAGPTHVESMSVRAIVTRDDLGISPGGSGQPAPTPPNP